MIDQSSIDLIQLIGGKLKRVARTQGGEYAGACPFCGGRDRFRVWPDRGRWWCRVCERHGDALSFVQQREGFGFGEALHYLGLQGNEPTWSPAPREPVLPEAVEPPPHEWQQAALAFAEQAQAALWGDYDRPLTWLRGRGFTDATIAAAQIGYQPRDEWVSRAAWGLEPDGDKQNIWLPRGIVIPWFVDGLLWKLFIRRPIPPGAWEAVRRPPQDAPVPRGIPATVLRCLREQRSYLTVEVLARRCDLTGGDVQAALVELDAAKLVQRPTKHYQVPGGSNCIYNADAVQRGKPAVLVEAALDALAIQQEAGDLVAAVATGTTGARGIRWIGKLAGCNPILLSYDNDQGGTTPTSYWRDVLRKQAHIWRPYPDDPAAMLEHGFDVRAWVAAGLRHAGYAAICDENAERTPAPADEPEPEQASEPPAPAEAPDPEPAPVNAPPAPPARPVARTRPHLARNVEAEPLRLATPNTSADAATVAATLTSEGIPAGWRWEPARPYSLVHDESDQRTSMDVCKQRVIAEALSIELDWRVPRAYAAYEAQQMHTAEQPLR
jgi:hypothetical protein